MAKSITVALELDDRQFKKNLRSSSDAVDTLSSRFGALKGAVAAAVTGFAAKGVIDATLKMENFRTTLTSYLGTQEAANAEIQRLSTLAKGLPQDVDALTESFVILKRNGIDTSNEAMTAFAKVAAGNGKSIQQLAEAVADGLTGNFARMEEFGIKVNKENDKFVMRMADGSAKIVNSTQEVVDAVRKQGEAGGKFANVVAGPMSQAFSNLRGAIFEVSTAFGAGFAPAIADASSKVSEALDKNKEFLASIGKLIGQGLTLLIENLDIVIPMIGAFAAGWAAIKFAALIDMLKGVAAGIKLITVAIAANPIGALAIAVTAAVTAFVLWAKELGSTEMAFKKLANGATEALNKIYRYGEGVFNYITTLFKSLAKNINLADILTGDTDAMMAAITQAADDAAIAFQDTMNAAGPFTIPYAVDEQVFDDTRAAMENLNMVGKMIQEELNKGTDANIQKVQDLKGTYAILGEQVNTLTGEHKVNVESMIKDIDAQIETLIKKAEQRKKNAEDEIVYTAEEIAALQELEKEKERVRKEEERERKRKEREHERETERAARNIQDTIRQFEQDLRNYDLQLERIGKTEVEIELLEETNRLNNEREEELAKIYAMNRSQEEMNALLLYTNKLYDEQIVKIRDKIVATDEAQKSFSTGWSNAWAKFKDDATNNAKAAEKVFGSVTGAMEKGFNQFIETGKVNFKGLVKDMLKEIAKVLAKKLFFKALDFLFPGLGSVGSFFDGLFDKGGFIKSGHWGIVGEKGPEIVTGPAKVVGREDTAKLLGSGGGGVANITLNINAVDAQSFQSLVARNPEFIYNVAMAGAKRVPGAMRV